MSIDRRRVLQYAGASCALAALPSLAETNASWRAYEVMDDLGLPHFRAGERLVADTAVSQFTGTGLYLYPAWGAPRLYAVRASGKGLEFRNPGSGQLLWTQSAHLAAVFAGRVPDGTDHAALAAALPGLNVPRRPLTA